MLLNVSERPKIENNRFCQRHKRKKEKIGVSVNDISMKKRFLVLKRGAERRKRDFWCLSVARKDEKESFGA